MLENDHGFVGVVNSIWVRQWLLIWFACANEYLQTYRLLARYALLHIPILCILMYVSPCLDILWKTSYILHYINKCTKCFIIFSTGLTIPKSHQSGNVIQCIPRRKHMCTNWQRQYKLLHSYMDYCCIRWCLQEQNHIYKYMKKHKHNVHTVVSFYCSGFSCSRNKTDRNLWDDLC